MLQNSMVESSPGSTESEWREEQNNDIDIGPVVRLVKQNLHQSYKVKEDDPTGMKILMKYHRDFILRKGFLYRKVQLKNQYDIVFQFVLPKTFQKKTVLAFYDKMEHIGMDQPLVLLQSRFFWPKMSEDVQIHIRSCDKYTRFKQL